MIISGLCFFLPVPLFSQDYFSYGGGNFSGLNQVICNPASAADNRLKVDVVIAGFDMNFNNSWFFIKREALQVRGNFLHSSTLKFPDTWRNSTPNVPDNLFKNFLKMGGKGDHSLILENRALLPSFMIQINERNSIAFTWSTRQIINVDGISPELGYLFEHELDLSVTQNNRVQNKNLTAIQAMWSEYGFTYARVLMQKGKHFLKAGVTPKLVKGLESTYLKIQNLDFLFSTKDTTSYFKSDLSYASSVGSGENFRINLPFSGAGGSGNFLPALDLGLVYEWRPDHLKYLYKPDGKNNAWRKDLNKYKLRLGFSVNDIGKLKFVKEENYYDLHLSIHQSDVVKYVTASDFRMLDSLLKHDFPANRGPKEFQVSLPVALNAQMDYCLNGFIYLNLSGHFARQYNETFAVHNYNSVCFSPRFESYWAELSLPVTWNSLSASRGKTFSPGVNLRLGPFCAGSNDLVPLFKNDIASLQFYLMLKISVPYKRIKDRDGDRVNDRKDYCPDIPGDVKLGGCPDSDQDGIADKDDACPHQSGKKELSGCPDRDEDGIADKEDRCPDTRGVKWLKGCPDSDGDSIPDAEDSCMHASGPRVFNGCPDSDGDYIPDKNDLCPDAKGLRKYRGCGDRDLDQVHDGMDECPDAAGSPENKGCPWPDSDKDGIIDKLDSCAAIVGVKEFKGCPPPPVVAAVEKRVLQKAYSSLEFETGKDKIRPASFPSLNALANVLKSHSRDWVIRLSGHTDATGSALDYLKLSEARTKAVQKFLIGKGVPQENIVVEWFGSERPIAENSGSTGRQKDRRVEMKVEGR
jgi:outer membrane protein OmpA-like peptidoglycan-associated protein